jgi:hypothetical protein
MMKFALMKMQSSEFFQLSILLAFILCIGTILHSYEFQQNRDKVEVVFEKSTHTGEAADNESIEEDNYVDSSSNESSPVFKDEQAIGRRFSPVLSYLHIIWEPPKVS